MARNLAIESIRKRVRTICCSDASENGSELFVALMEISSDPFSSPFSSRTARRRWCWNPTRVVRLGVSCSTARTTRGGWSGRAADDASPRLLPSQPHVDSTPRRQCSRTLDMADDRTSRHKPADTTTTTVTIAARPFATFSPRRVATSLPHPLECGQSRRTGDASA